MSVHQAVVPGPAVRSCSYFEVATALAKLQGHLELIRHRLDRAPADHRPAIVATLDAIEGQLEAAERAGLVPST